MEELEWNNFMFAIVLRVVILLITVKIVDYFANTLKYKYRENFLSLKSATL